MKKNFTIYIYILLKGMIIVTLMVVYILSKVVPKYVYQVKISMMNWNIAKIDGYWKYYISTLIYLKQIRTLNLMIKDYYHYCYHLFFIMMMIIFLWCSSTIVFYNVSFQMIFSFEYIMYCLITYISTK